MALRPGGMFGGMFRAFNRHPTSNQEALISAAENGNVSEVVRLLNKGVNKDYQDEVRYFVAFNSFSARLL